MQCVDTPGGVASRQPGLKCHEPAWVSLTAADYHSTADSRYESEQTRGQEELHTGQIARLKAVLIGVHGIISVCIYY